MKYLFFDIECSNSFNKKPKMCEFGYVLTDSNFKVIRKDDIPMSPGRRCGDNKFDKAIHKREPGFDWAYDSDYYFACPEFPTFYGTIRKLLEMEDTILFGFAVDNDIRFLDFAIKRYNLDAFRYVVYDIQTMVSHFSQMKGLTNLETTFKSFCPIEEFIRLQPHLSRDDAYMSMRILEELSKSNGLTPFEIVQSDKRFCYDSEEYLTNYYKEIEEKQERTFCRLECERLCHEFYKECSSLGVDIENPRKIVRMSGVIKTNLSLLKETIDAIKEKGFISTKRRDEYDYFVTANKEDLQKVRETSRLCHRAIILTLEDFKKL